MQRAGTVQEMEQTNDAEVVRIAICDDDTALQKILRQKIEKICLESRRDCQVMCYASGEELMKQEQVPHILFLDIQMPGRNGMEIAQELRKEHKDMILIFVTALAEYVYDAFDVDAMHYLVKPFLDDKLRDVMDRAMYRYDNMRQTESDESRKKDAARLRRQDSIVVKRGGMATKVNLDDIMYAEVFNRKVMLHTTNGDIEYYGKLTDLSELAGDNFYRTHRAYLVNFKYVERYNAATIWLEKGTALVSKKQFAGFVKQYMRYINRERGR